MKYECICGYIYDEVVGEPDSAVQPGTVWADVPEDFECPFCGADKMLFSQMQ